MQAATRREYDRRSKAFYDLCVAAQMSPDSRMDAERIHQRLQRRGKRTRLATVERIIYEYDHRPHLCSIRTFHAGRGCKLGASHAGCCPGCPGED